MHLPSGPFVRRRGALPWFYSAQESLAAPLHRTRRNRTLSRPKPRPRRRAVRVPSCDPVATDPGADVVQSRRRRGRVPAPTWRSPGASLFGAGKDTGRLWTAKLRRCRHDGLHVHCLRAAAHDRRLARCELSGRQEVSVRGGAGPARSGLACRATAAFQQVQALGSFRKFPPYATGVLSAGRAQPAKRDGPPEVGRPLAGRAAALQVGNAHPIPSHPVALCVLGSIIGAGLRPRRRLRLWRLPAPRRRNKRQFEPSQVF